MCTASNLASIDLKVIMKREQMDQRRGSQVITPTKQKLFDFFYFCEKLFNVMENPMKYMLYLEQFFCAIFLEKLSSSGHYSYSSRAYYGACFLVIL
jgi:hypothetical protein